MCSTPFGGFDPCAIFWNETDHLPLSAVLDYWCKGDAKCREARKQAILTACRRGDVNYRRRDGRTYDDPVEELAASDLLLIERASFERWAERFASAERPNLPLDGRERQTLWALIRALADKAGIDIKQPHKAGAQIETLLAKHGMALSARTIGEHLKKVHEAIPPTRPQGWQ